MEIMDYKSNSHKSKENRNAPEEKKKVQKVVKGTVKTKKKNSISKLTDVFVSEDIHTVGHFIFTDVVVPTVKKVIVDIITEGANMFFFGDRGRGGRSSSNSSYISYRSYSDRRDAPTDRVRTGYSHEDIILESRGEAEEVLIRMDELIDTYGTASVADLYDLVGKSCHYTDHKYGWTNLRNAEPVRVRDGYMLKLPKAGPINQ